VIFQGLLERQPEIAWLRERGAARFPFRASSVDGIVEGTVAGQGIAALPTLVAAGIASLRRLRAEEDPPSKPVYLAMHRDLRSVWRVRAVADALAADLARASAAES
jgi:DNA-binding transcriptional LysR family regulator